MSNKRLSVPNKNKIRNLAQYKNLTDDEFDEIFEARYMGSEDTVNNLEERIQLHLDNMNQDYDLSDMKANDRLQLRALIQAIIQLEDLEQKTYIERQDITPSNVLILDKLNSVMSRLRSDISAISEDLQLTKKIRSESKEASVAIRWSDLVEKASEFYKKKMLYVFCPDCRLLLATVWLLYPDNNNKLSLKCEHCGKTESIDLNDLYKTKNRNLEDVQLAR